MMLAIFEIRCDGKECAAVVRHDDPGATREGTIRRAKALGWGVSRTRVNGQRGCGARRYFCGACMVLRRPRKGVSTWPHRKANKAPRETITRADLSRKAFANAKDLPQVVDLAGRRMRWVGIGWVDEGPAKGTEVQVIA